MAVVFEERKHPRDRLGRFRTKIGLPNFPEGVSVQPMSTEEAQDASFDWTQGLDPEQAEAISLYARSGSDSRAMNGFLRGNGEADDDQKRAARSLSEALAEARMPRDTVVYRSYRDRELMRESLNGDIRGATIEDRGFMSTTLDTEAIAANLDPMLGGETEVSGDPADVDRITDIVATIRIPKGARAAFIGGLSAYPDEAEVLMQDGTMTRITGVRYPEGTGTLHLSMDVVEQLGGGEKDGDEGEMLG